MFSKNYIKSETDLGKLKRLEPMYNGCKANWRTKAEMDMIKASIKVRSKPKWGSGLEDKTVREQWIGEMKSNSGLTDKQAAYVIAELFYYAKLQAAARCCGGDAKLSVVDMVWYTDIPEDSDMAQ
ncbi:hypothetical protein LPJ57_000362, partial [Coemansia sp. RSA 486]